MLWARMVLCLWSGKTWPGSLKPAQQRMGTAGRKALPETICDVVHKTVKAIRGSVPTSEAVMCEKKLTSLLGTNELKEGSSAHAQAWPPVVIRQVLGHACLGSRQGGASWWEPLQCASRGQKHATQCAHAIIKMDGSPFSAAPLSLKK